MSAVVGVGGNLNVGSLEGDQFKSLFLNLVHRAGAAESSFEEIQAKFYELERTAPSAHCLKYDELLPEEKGARFYMASEIKGQQAHKVVDPILNTVYEASCRDGYTRQSLMKAEPNGPFYRERIYMFRKSANEHILIYVQIFEDDLFACLNEVVSVGGRWHWKGTYLTGGPFTEEDVREKGATLQNMLRLMDAPDFEAQYRAIAL